MTLRFFLGKKGTRALANIVSAKVAPLNFVRVHLLEDFDEMTVNQNSTFPFLDDPALERPMYGVIL